MPTPLRSIGASALVLASVLGACGTAPSAEAEVDGAADSGSPMDAGVSDVGGDDAQADGSAPDVVAPPDTGGPDAGGPDAPEPDAEITDPSIGPDPGLVEACEGACFEREQLGSEFGFCALQDDRSCEDFCVDAVDDQPGDVQVALMACLKTDPLCFQTPLQCVLTELYPEPFEHTTRLIGEGYDAWIGAPVYAAMEREGRPGTFDAVEGVVDADGRFELGISAVRYANSPHTVYYFVDSETDGACDETREMVGYAGLDLYAWPLDEVRVPDWRVSVEPDADRRAAFACDLLEDAIAP